MNVFAVGIIGATTVWMGSACGTVKIDRDGGDVGSGGAEGETSSFGGAGRGGITENEGGESGVCRSCGGLGGVSLGGGGSVGAAGGEVGSTVPIVVTSSQGSYWQQGQLSEVTSGDVDVTVHDSSEAQIWEGFGGAFTELGWSYLSKLSQALRDQAIQLLFGSDGARFAWGRIPIGGNDYVLSRYTLDDTGDDVIPDGAEENRPPADPSLASFSIDRDKRNLIPYVKAAQAVKSDLRFWAVPWTPPVWMKTGYKKDDEGSGGKAARPSYYDGGRMKRDDATLQAHAKYFVKFVEAYKDQGVNVELVAPQNEPGYEQNYPSCLWDKTTYTNFIGKFLGPALRGAGLSTRIMIGSLDSSRDSDLAAAVLADSTAKEYCAVAGVGYDMVDPSELSAFKSAGLPVWVSEHKAGNYPWEPDYKATAPNDFAYAVESFGLIRDAITKASVSAYNAWNMVLDEVGRGLDMSRPWAQNALLVADSGQLTATPAYYVFRHFSRYVEPGAKVVGASGGDAVAFKNPGGSLVAVLYNSGSAKTMTVAMAGKKLQFSVPSSAFATVFMP